MLKGKSDVGGDDYKAKDLRDQASESQNIQVFVGVVKGDTGLKIFHSMVKYNDMFDTNYERVEWLVQENRTSNELRLWMKNMRRMIPISRKMIGSLAANHNGK